jgi:hypothetical protein
VNAIVYSPVAQTLMSGGEDTNIVLWNMAAQRLEVGIRVSSYDHELQRPRCKNLQRHE